MVTLGVEIDLGSCVLSHHFPLVKHLLPRSQRIRWSCYNSNGVDDALAN